MRQTLADQLLTAPPAKQSFSGPWTALFEEHSGWDSARPLSRDLYSDLRGHFDDNLIRELLLAAANFKVTRTSLSDKQIKFLRELAERHGFQIAVSETKWRPYVDKGKGGWANRMMQLTEANNSGGIRNIYIASDAALAETARMLDEAGEDDLFGAILGIPLCCREMFDDYKHLAAEKQFDFVPFVLNNTHGAMPFDWRLNYTAQYFGSSLLSFFPCSFRCPVAASVADKTLAMLADCDATWARQFTALQQSNVLYTENSGLHLFQARLCDRLIIYEGLRSTEANALTELLQHGDRLEICSKHAVRIYRGSTTIGELNGDDVCMCSFY
jgi:hypothetical protein